MASVGIDAVASRLQLLRHLLAEGLVIGLTGGLLGGGPKRLHLSEARIDFVKALGQYAPHPPACGPRSAAVEPDELFQVAQSQPSRLRRRRSTRTCRWSSEPDWSTPAPG